MNNDHPCSNFIHRFEKTLANGLLEVDAPY